MRVVSPSLTNSSPCLYAHEQGDPHQVFSHRVMEITCAYVEDHLRDGPHSKNASWQCAWKEVEVVVLQEWETSIPRSTVLETRIQCP